MPKVGSAEYPDLLFSKALEAVETIRRENVKTAEALAKALGHKNHRSGPAHNKLAALNKYYGLIEQNRTDVSLSRLGQRIAFPVSDADRFTAAREAVSRVALFKELYQALGTHFSPHDFRPKLRDITGASNEDVAKKGPYLERAYRDIIPYLDGYPTSVEENNEDTEVSSDNSPDENNFRRRHDRAPLNDVSSENMWVFESKEVVIRVQKNTKALTLAKTMIQALETTLTNDE